MIETVLSQNKIPNKIILI